jgi:hypothetical protein
MKLLIDGRTYIISSRKAAAGKKAELFLLLLSGSSRKYISSLYPTGNEGIYRFEYEGNRYILNRDKCTIIQCA